MQKAGGTTPKLDILSPLITKPSSSGVVNCTVTGREYLSGTVMVLTLFGTIPGPPEPSVSHERAYFTPLHPLQQQLILDAKAPFSINSLPLYKYSGLIF
jgi:hypothetical protein